MYEKKEIKIYHQSYFLSSFWPHWGFGILGNNIPREFMIKEDNVKTFVIHYPPKKIHFTCQCNYGSSFLRSEQFPFLFH